MKRTFLAALSAAVTFTAVPARADGYIMGAGRWPCSRVLEVVDGDPTGDYFQLAGWILGFWSRETLDRNTDFNDKIEGIGGQKVFAFTVDACRKVPPETALYKLTQEIIRSSE